jgi:predicted nucleic-acid-binding protein
MKQDEVVQTLREVIAEAENFTTWTVSTPHLVELVKRAVEAEREACAKVVDHILKEGGGTWGDAIRARGQA